MKTITHQHIQPFTAGMKKNGSSAFPAGNEELATGAGPVSPHPDPLPQGEGTVTDTLQFSSDFAVSAVLRFGERRRMILPLSKGEGRGEGKGNHADTCLIHYKRRGTQKILFAFVSLLMAAAAFSQTPATTNSPNHPVRSSLHRLAPLPAGVKAERNIPYVENGHHNQVLDIFLPEQRSDKPLPLMIWIHGGAWTAGIQANPPVVYLATNGFAVASIQYRFSQDAIWPAQGYDCKAAIRWLRANAARYNFDPNHFGVGGDSAGGHLAAFIGTSGDVPEMEGNLGNTNVSSRVQAVVDWFGPTDLTLMAQQSGPGSMLQHDAANSPESFLLGGPVQEKKDLARTANPLTYINKNNPPFLIMHGDNDQLVPLAQSEILAKALKDAGVEVTMKTIQGAGHEGPQFRSPENQRLMEEFLSRNLKPAQ